jgi:hypothetical protein
MLRASVCAALVRRDAPLTQGEVVPRATGSPRDGSPPRCDTTAPRGALLLAPAPRPPLAAPPSSQTRRATSGWSSTMFSRRPLARRGPRGPAGQRRATYLRTRGDGAGAARACRALQRTTVRMAHGAGGLRLRWDGSRCLAQRGEVPCDTGCFAQRVAREGTDLPLQRRGEHTFVTLRMAADGRGRLQRKLRRRVRHAASGDGCVPARRFVPLRARPSHRGDEGGASVRAPASPARCR